MNETTQPTLREAARLYRDGNLEGAAACYRAAAATGAPADERLAALLGLTRISIDLGRLDAATSCCREAIACAPERSGPYGVLAHALASSGALDAAAEAAAAALERSPRDALMLHLSSAIALRRAMPRASLDWSMRALSHDRHDQRALSDFAFALESIGAETTPERVASRRADPLTAASLLDFARLVRVSEVEPPPGYASVDAFNAELATAISSAAWRARPSAIVPMVGGTRVPDTFALEGACVGHLREILRAAVDDYVASLAIADSHPVATGRPPRFRLVSWANVMLSGDHERPHIHEAGWLSGVYYVEMPPPIGSAPDVLRGALLLGGHHCETGQRRPLRRIEPRAGQLALFPSYITHRTEPFEGAGRRISVAFDVPRH